MSKNNACLVPVVGASGSGKSVFVRRFIESKRPPRCLVWNPLQKTTPYPGEVVASLGELEEKATRRGKFSLVFVPTFANDEDDRPLMPRQFDLFCEIALEVGNVFMFAEELKYVTKPQWAPPNWRRVTGDGRQYGLRVFGTSQRPAQIDKDFLGNATMIRTGRLVYPDDIKTMASFMRVDRSKIEALQPLDWIEKNMETFEEHAGRITFP